MPNILRYRGGSVIYFQGDAADKIYVIQKGSVRVTYQNIETGSDEHETLLSGEFFGVKSVLGRYSREENAAAVQDSVILAMSAGEFEQFAVANTRIVMKMLKVFSNQLRRIHRQVTNLMVKEEQPNSEDGLFKVGEYYLKNNRYIQARYVFSRYLTYYPAGENSKEATKGLEIAETALAQQNDVQVTALPSSGAGFIVGAEGSFAIGAGGFSTHAGNLQAGSGEKPAGFNLTGVAKAYDDALKFIVQEKYSQAYVALRKIIETGKDQEYIAKSAFDLGRCFFLMGKFNDSIQHFTQVITKYPRHPELGSALFFMGQSYERTNRKDQAAAFYKKVLTVVTDEKNEVHVKAKQSLKVLGV
jgi:TolA-binding protein